MRGLVQAGNRVYGVTAGQFWAVDVETRQVLWSFKSPTKVPWSFDVPLAADGAVYVGTHGTLLKLQ